MCFQLDQRWWKGCGSREDGEREGDKCWSKCGYKQSRLLHIECSIRWRKLHCKEVMCFPFSLNEQRGYLILPLPFLRECDATERISSRISIESWCYCILLYSSLRSYPLIISKSSIIRWVNLFQSFNGLESSPAVCTNFIITHHDVYGAKLDVTVIC